MLLANADRLVTNLICVDFRYLCQSCFLYLCHYLLAADFMFWNLGGRLILILTFFGFSSTISLDCTSSKLSLELSLESLLICFDLTLFKGILLSSDLLPASCLVDFWSDNPCELWWIQFQNIYAFYLKSIEQKFKAFRLSNRRLSICNISSKGITKE